MYNPPSPNKGTSGEFSANHTPDKFAYVKVVRISLVLCDSFGSFLRLTMAKVISQETFDETVKENVVEFEMSVEEAKEETIKQFQAQVRFCCKKPFGEIQKHLSFQGVNLGNIIVDLKVNSSTGRPIVLEKIKELKKIEGITEGNRKDVLEIIQVISEECSKVIHPSRIVFF